MLLNKKYYLSNLSNVENVICTKYHRKDDVLYFTFLMLRNKKQLFGNFYETARIYNYCID